MIIKNARTFLNGVFTDLEVRFDGNGITEIGHNLTGDEVIDAEGNYLFAGIIDTHCHGGFMCSFAHESRTDSFGDRKHHEPDHEKSPHHCRADQRTGR